jgi:hypothetical protein
MVDMSVQSFAALGAIMSGSEIAVLFTPEACDFARRVHDAAGSTGGKGWKSAGVST